MASPFSHDGGRRARLQQIAAAWGIHPTIPPVTVQQRPPQRRTPQDDFQAEELLKRQRLNAAADGNKNSQNGGIKRAFSSNKKPSGTWDPNEIFEALDALVANRGAPRVADALIAKLVNAGGNVNVSAIKNKTHLLTRRKSLENLERSRVLQRAVRNRHTDMVAVLVQYADPLSLDAALPLAIRSGDLEMLAMLLQQGANTTQTQDAQDAFRQLCIMGGHADLVGLILQSEGRPSSQWVSMSMVDAARKGCLQTVMRLSRSTADGEYHKAEALKTAIAQCRVDIALAILTGTKPPTQGGQGVLESFARLLEHTSLGPNDRLPFTEALLCAGASGEPIAMALAQASINEYYDMVDLLVSYGASVEYQDASIVRHALSTGRTSLAQLLLSERSTLSPAYASECLESIPKNIAPEDRHAMLSLLLRKGAGGPRLHEVLVDVVKANDLQSAQLLLTPQFPGGQSVSSHDLRNGQHGMVSIRHEVASVDHRDGMALSIAVQMGQLPMVKQLLVGRPSTQTLDQVFSPSVRALQPAIRYQIAELFLNAGLSSRYVSVALQEAIEEQPPRRDENFISLLLRFNADVNFNDGAGILSAIAIRDLPLLERLLTNKPAPPTMAAAVRKAMDEPDREIRYRMLSLLVPGAGHVETSQALAHALAVKPVDTQLVKLLLEQGRADANFDQGASITLAINDPDPSLLEHVLQYGGPSPDTLFQALAMLSEAPTNQVKATKVDSILRRTRDKNILNAILVKEVQTLLKITPEKRQLAVISSLLAAGADVNSNKAAALSCAVKAADSAIVDLLFTANPTATSLAAALPQSLNILDPMDRLTFTQKLVVSGAPGAEANRALVYAINAHPNDLPLISLLATHADSSGGDALITAIKKENVEIVQLVLDKSSTVYSQQVLQDAFVDALLVTSKIKRVAICKALLVKGVKGQTISDALLSAASDGDIELGRVLTDYGASADHRDGQAIVGACGAGSKDVVKMLLRGQGGQVGEQTLVKAFQAASQVADLKRREDVFRILLDKGVKGEAVDAQLVSAAKFGDDGEGLVRLLLEHGASVDYNAGEAIWNVTRGANMGSLKLMLGIDSDKEQQKKPNKVTLLRSLKASRKLSRDSRLQVVDWLFQAGMPPCEEVNIALNRVVKEDPDLRLVGLLLKNGASPLSNGCETLTDAAQMLLVDVLQLLLAGDIPQKDVSWTFKQAFTPETSATWFSEKGFQVAKMLLAKGAEGESLTLALMTAIDAYDTEKDELARKFAGLLLQHKVDVSYEDGIVLQKAAQRADADLIRQVLQQNPDSRAVSLAFGYIFDHADLSEEDTLRLITLFTDYHDGEERLDVMFPPVGTEPVLFRALTKFPRSVRILETLLDAGYYHDQMTTLRVMDDIDEEEQVNLLFWAISQPQKRISSSVIELLVDRGAKVNFETKVSKTTPLMLAIRAKRQDVVKCLILAGAEVDVMDVTGNTPMTMATEMGGELGTSIMSNILAADPNASQNDGSVHNAARELNLQALKVLVEFGHDVDFPSTLHGGRSALGELCLNAASGGSLSASQEKQMQKCMSYLIREAGSDLTIQCEGKSVLLLALESLDPIATTGALLKTGVWKYVNEPYNQFTDGTCTYSPSQYVQRVLPNTKTKPQLLELLKANRCKDVFYGNDPAQPQPEGALNLPPELLRAERERRAMETRIQKEREEHTAALSRQKEIADFHNQLFKTRAEIEDSRTRRMRQDELDFHKVRQQQADMAFAQELQRRKAEREANVEAEQRLTEAGLTRARLIKEAELEMEEKKQEKMIGYANQMSSVRIREREAIDRVDAASEARMTKRLQEHRRLVEGQNQLAGRLQNGVDGQGRRLGGYITGELD
ncbi:hypothetical protein B0T21DRAFT_297726 [Apiosordaria backusii]|uniref:Ankyrin repeat containing protein n=1 Tax=Apiosordaria backusii TaxID=314023 RepID=A0AA40AAS0_9PEZI|nr:hypothetical protein B0T21DRAFT_297726 [Apiosordaria backusii]